MLNLNITCMYTTLHTILKINGKWLCNISCCSWIVWKSSFISNTNAKLHSNPKWFGEGNMYQHSVLRFDWFCGDCRVSSGCEDGPQDPDLIIQSWCVAHRGH